MKLINLMHSMSFVPTSHAKFSDRDVKWIHSEKHQLTIITRVQAILSEFDLGLGHWDLGIFEKKNNNNNNNNNLHMVKNSSRFFFLLRGTIHGLDFYLFDDRLDHCQKHRRSFIQ